MGSSIFDLFADAGDPEGEGDKLLDSPTLDSTLDELLKTRPVAGRPAGFEPEVPLPDGEVHGTEDGVPAAPASIPPGTPASPPSEPPPAAPPAPVAPPTAPPADPFAGLTDLERYELLQYRQALNDPERALAVKRAILGVPDERAVVPAQAAPPPAPTLPEEIEPGSWEAQMWQQNQDLVRQIAEIKEGQQQSRAQNDQEIKNAAAVRSTTTFANRYVGRLSKEEIEAVCQTAGMQRLPDAFRPTTGTWDEAMDKALEFTLRSNDALLAKVLGVAPAAPAAPPPDQRTPEAVHRGRQLTALSSAASPSGDTPQRTPIVSRNDGTGKMSEKSRLALVQEMMSGGAITGTPGEGI
jgi:hypothetical protein